MQDILAQIRAQEDSERFAEQLQREEYEDFVTPDNVSSVSEDAMVIDSYDDDIDGEDEDPEMQDIIAQIKAQEGSEALAVQPHLQNGHEIASGSYNFPLSIEDDSSEVEILPDPPQFASSSMSGLSRSAEKQTGKLRDDDREGHSLSLVRPDEVLGPLRDIFTRIRECTNCGELVKSPRGYVRAECVSIQILYLFKRDFHPGHLFRNIPPTESRFLVARPMPFVWN